MAHAKDDNTVRLYWADGSEVEKIEYGPLTLSHSPREVTQRGEGQSDGWAKFIDGKKSFTLDFNKLEAIDDKIMEGEIEYYYNRKGKYFFRTASGGRLTIIPIEPIKLKYGKYPAKIKFV